MSKIYRVSSTLSLMARFVRANNRQAAVNFVARDTLVGNLATQDELVSAITAGTKIEDASSPQLDMLDMLDDTLKQDKPMTATEALQRRSHAAGPSAHAVMDAFKATGGLKDGDVILMPDGSKIQLTGSISDPTMTGINDEVLF